MRTTPLALYPLAAVLALTLAADAGATPNFPSAIQQDLSLSYAPDCSLCHTDGDTGGLGTVNTPFGISVRAHGLVAYDTSALAKALSEMKADGTDSIGDCVSDISELEAGKNPNVNETGKTCAPTAEANTGPEYGCGAHVSRKAPPQGWGEVGSLVAMLAAAVARRRRRRAPRRRPQ